VFLRPYPASAALLLVMLACTSGASADGIAEKAQICASCHGERGVPIDPKIPVIWGQNAGYLYIELRDFKRGARKNDQMAMIVQALAREDMLGLADYFSKQPWPHLAQERAADGTVRHAEAAASSGQCPQCHLGGYLGASTTPRLANQSEQYLAKTMQDFRSGGRANNSWMTDLLKTYQDQDIAALAQYLAGL
jgi:cytochrome c553